MSELIFDRIEVVGVARDAGPSDVDGQVWWADLRYYVDDQLAESAGVHVVVSATAVSVYGDELEEHVVRVVERKANATENDGRKLERLRAFGAILVSAESW